jgi:manganese oxidase
VHPTHIHGGPVEVVAVDGLTLSATARYQADTVNVGPNQRYDVIWTRKWLVHRHIPHHTENNNTETNGGGGLILVLNVQ